MGALLGLVARYQALLSALRGILSAGTEIECRSAELKLREDRAQT